MNSSIYIVEALTNMHVGSGDNSFGIIDNLVQRDAITEYPTIHSSSLKGALRKYFEYKNQVELVKTAFGDKDKSGSFRFFDGNLLSIPVRSNKRPFFRGVCPRIIIDFLQTAEKFKIKFSNLEKIREMLNIELKDGSPIVFGESTGLRVEDYEPQSMQFECIQDIETILGKDIVLFTDSDFNSIVAGLPVIARNHLENGISQNLWYEEIVPRESRFFFGVLYPESNTDEYAKFDELISGDLIQIGANASIGYGFTKIRNIYQITGEAYE